MRNALIAASALAICTLSACAGSAGALPGAPAPNGQPAGGKPAPSRTLPDATGGKFPAASWPAYGGNPSHTGAASGVPPAGPLRIAWHAPLDGAVYGQPLVIGDLVVAATENDTVYGLNARTGRVVWHRHVGTPVPLSALPCGNIDPTGITGTPAYDQANGLVYALAETSGFHHVLFGLSVTDGTIRVERDIPAPDGQPRYDQQRPALTILDGRVYVAFGGFAGDCGPYRGSVVGVPVSGSGPLVSYLVPTPREGAVWATAGPVAGPGGSLYVSVGNGSVTSKQFDGSDSVTALSPTLHRVGIFAPTTWFTDNENDLDLGSAQPALLADGRLVETGKSGTGYLLDPAHLGGVGGQIAQAQICPAYGGAAVSGQVVYEPCHSGGIAAVRVSGSSMHVLWRGPADAWGSPVVGGGAVWVSNPSSGMLYTLDPASGAVRSQISVGAAQAHFGSLSLAGRYAYVPTTVGVTAVNGA